jgi:phospholipase/carboxylesterase
MRALADEVGLVLVAVDSRGISWPQAVDDFGPDIEFIDAALTRVYKKVNVDPARIRVAGFSDGASFALSLGLINGDLIGKIAAFSPGYIAPGVPKGKPKILITHGTRDQILPIDQTSRRIVPMLKREGYGVDYQEFDGPHRFTPEILKNAAAWLSS